MFLIETISKIQQKLAEKNIDELEKRTFFQIPARIFRHYRKTEDCEDQMEYCFKEQGKELFEAVLNSKVNQNKDKSIREILAGLSPEELWLG